MVLTMLLSVFMSTERNNLLGQMAQPRNISIGIMEVRFFLKEISDMIPKCFLFCFLTEPNNFWGMETCGELVASHSGHWNDAHCR